MKQAHLKTSFNMLPRHILRERLAAEVISWAFVALTVLAAIMLLYIAWLTKSLFDYNLQKTTIQRQIEQAKPIVELNNRVNKLKDTYKTVSAFRDSITSVELKGFDILKQLEKVTPVAVTYSSVTLSQEGKLTLNGLAGNEIVVSDLIYVLKGTDMFSEVFLTSLNKKEAEDTGKTATDGTAAKGSSLPASLQGKVQEREALKPDAQRSAASSSYTSVFVINCTIKKDDPKAQKQVTPAPLQNVQVTTGAASPTAAATKQQPTTVPSSQTKPATQAKAR